MSFRLVAAAAFLIFALNVSAAQAERPIVDLHRLDSYFQLFAADSSVPWKPATVRLDTYSSAAVAFSVYAVDPADVLTAGANFNPRPLVTAHRRAVATFNFTPPGGYQFQSSQVSVPLGTREGFFVVEARRGDVGEQVWINRSRVGLFSKETPGGSLFYGVDLGTGAPVQRMRVQLVVNNAFVTSQTDAQGAVRWNRSSRPVFALAQWGSSYAFLSPLPQAPVPGAIVGVRTDSAVVHAGGVLHVVGFVRTRAGNVLRAGSGSALVSLRNGARMFVAHRVAVDEAGAFAGELAVPADAGAGDYTVLAQAAGGTGGAAVHVDANAGDLSLDVRSACNGLCDYRQDVPLLVHASRGNVLVDVTAVRSPHVYLGAAPETTPWATTKWSVQSVRVDAGGNATVTIPRPDDNLGSTYGIVVASGGATAQTRVVVPTADAAIDLRVDRTEQSLGSPLSFDVEVETIEGKPLPGASVRVDLVHGGSTQEQQITLDAQGHARAAFNAPELGTNLIFASVDHGGRATDGAQVQVDPQASVPAADGRSPNVRISLGPSDVRAGQQVAVDADAPGSQGDALISYESALGIQFDVVRTDGGHAVARVRALDAAGDLRVGAAFVHGGAIEWSTVPLTLSAPGRPHLSELTLHTDHLTTGEPARVSLDGAGAGKGTFVLRVSRGAPSGAALFSSAPALLAIALTSTQDSAPEDLTWHPCVDSTGNRAQILGFVRRSQPPDESLAQAETETVVWRVVRSDGSGIAFDLPARGRYVVSLLDIADDGSVIAGSTTMEVR
ncbi:MAG TPA: hypothetical protein VIX83_05665 [Candidatus Cybelea sp.]